MIEDNENFDDNSILPFVIKKNFFALRELRKSFGRPKKKVEKIFENF